jgi:uncharacterized membrane protein YjfL (UPF0719 family)
MLNTVLIRMLIWAAYAYDVFLLALRAVQFFIRRYQDVERRFANRTGNHIPAV